MGVQHNSLSSWVIDMMSKLLLRNICSFRLSCKNERKFFPYDPLKYIYDEKHISNNPLWVVSLKGFSWSPLTPLIHRGVICLQTKNKTLLSNKTLRSGGASRAKGRCQADSGVGCSLLRKPQGDRSTKEQISCQMRPTSLWMPQLQGPQAPVFWHFMSQGPAPLTLHIYLWFVHEARWSLPRTG